MATQGRKLIANVDAREGPVLHLRLMDPSDSSSTTDPSASINAQLVREGFCSIDRKGCKYLNSYSTIHQRLRQDTDEAKRSRAGMYEFGESLRRVLECDRTVRLRFRDVGDVSPEDD